MDWEGKYCSADFLSSMGAMTPRMRAPGPCLDYDSRKGRSWSADLQLFKRGNNPTVSIALVHSKII